MIVGLCSSYLEGPLVQGAIRSLLAACDHVVVFEGPAGPPLEGNMPKSDFTPWTHIHMPDGKGGYIHSPRTPDHPHLKIVRGSWKTDAKKRTAMIESLRPFTEPTWGV